MSIWSKIGSFFKHAESEANVILEKILGSDEAHTFLVGAEAALDTTVGQIAKDAVTAAEAAGGTGLAKAEAAVKTIIAEAATKGIPLVESQARLFMELAVSELKGLFEPAAPAPPAASAPANPTPATT